MGNTFDALEPWMIGKVITISVIRMADRLAMADLTGRLAGFADNYADEFTSVQLAGMSESVDFDANHFYELVVFDD